MRIVLPNGIGQALGDQLVTGKNLVLSSTSTVYYVHSTGSDASNNGLQPERPFATLAQAITTAVDNDVIVLMAGHAETISTGLTIGERLTIVGGGSSGGEPTVTLTAADAAAPLFAITAGGSGCQLRNIKFPTPSALLTTARITCVGTDVTVRGCVFEAATNDAVATVSLGTSCDRIRLESCTFKSTATGAASRPASAIIIAAGVTVPQVDLKDCVFDGGAYGYVTTGGLGLSGYAVDFRETLTRIRVENLTLRGGADIALRNAAPPAGYLQISSVAGAGFVRLI